MATPTPSFVRSIALAGAAVTAALAALPDATIQVAIDEAALNYTQLVAWSLHEQVVALHALHILGTSGALAPAFKPGPVTSASAGGISQTVGVSAVEAAGGLDLRTPWGERAIGLLKRKPPSIRAARAGTGFSPFL